MPTLDYRPILEAAITSAKGRGNELKAEYRAKLDEYHRLVVDLSIDLIAGKISLEDAKKASQQLYNAVRSELLAAGLDARAAAFGVVQEVAMQVFLQLV